MFLIHFDFIVCPLSLVEADDVCANLNKRVQAGSMLKDSVFTNI